MSHHVIQIPLDKLVNAARFSAWNFSLWGMPKAKLICGGCTRPFETRRYIPFDRNKASECTVFNCPYCGKWNKVGIVCH